MFARRLFSIARPTTKFIPSGLHFARNTRPLFLRGSQVLFYNTEANVENQEEEQQPTSRIGREMLSYVRKKQFFNAMRLFEQAKGEQADLFTYNLALRICADYPQPNVHKAETLVEEMKEKGMQLDEFTYYQLVRLYGKVRDFGKARSTIELAESEGIGPSIRLYNVLLSSYAVSKQIDEALNVLQEIKEKNLNPNYRTYSSLIAALTEEGNTEKVNELLEELKSKEIRVPHNSIVSGFVRKGDFDSARAHIQEMIKENAQPESFTYGIIISGLLNQEKIDEAIEVFNEAKVQIPKDAGIYNNFVAYYFKQGNVEAAKEWLNKMNEDRVRFDRISMTYKNKLYPETQNNERRKFNGRRPRRPLEERERQQRQQEEQQEEQQKQE